MFIKTLSLTGVLLMFAAGVEEQTVPAAFVARKVAVGSYKLKLEERDGKCDLVYEGRNHKGTTLTRERINANSPKITKPQANSMAQCCRKGMRFIL